MSEADDGVLPHDHYEDEDEYEDDDWDEDEEDDEDGVYHYLNSE